LFLLLVAAAGLLLPLALLASGEIRGDSSGRALLVRSGRGRRGGLAGAVILRLVARPGRRDARIQLPVRVRDLHILLVTLVIFVRGPRIVIIAAVVQHDRNGFGRAAASRGRRSAPAVPTPLKAGGLGTARRR